MVSIIIPVYNQAKTLRGTLESINNQTFKDFEVIVVNDGSKDDPQASFESFLSENKIDNSFIFLNQVNRGAPSARNKGYNKSKGRYVIFCDSDAELEPEALEIMVDVLEKNPKVSYVYSSFKWGRKLFKVGEFDSEKLKREPYIHTMSLVRRSDLPTIGWDEKIKKFQDWDLWLTMLANGHRGIWVNKVLFKVKTGGTMSSWVPSFAYKAFPFLGVVKKYKAAKKVIKEKHGLN